MSAGRAVLAFPLSFRDGLLRDGIHVGGSTLYDTDRFGAALPRFTPRQSDLLMVVGTVSHKQAPILRKVYEQMCEPKWVIAFGVCATSGGFYQNYAALPGSTRSFPSTCTSRAARRGRRW